MSARPFRADTLRQASEIVARYTLLLEPDPELGFVGTALEMPLVMAAGRSTEDCLREIRAALISSVAALLEEGTDPPVPCNPEVRDVQINIRVTSREKRLLEQAAQRNGFRGISDFIRHAAIGQAK